MIRIQASSTSDLSRTARKLQRAGATGTVGVKARKNLVRVGRGPVVRDVQSAVRAVEVGSSRGGTARPNTSTDLRGRAAGAVNSAPTGAGVAIFVEGWRIGRNGSRLAQLLDTEDAPRWRHPVFSTPARAARGSVPWVGQTGQPWFYATIRAAEPRFAAAAGDAVDDTIREICS